MAVLDLRVNGVRRRVVADPGEGRSILELLREDLGLRSVKDGCAPEGSCGACTVLVDGRPTRACITGAATVAGKAVTTIEGIGEGGRLHPVQEAFLEMDAMQCGYCTPGMIVEGVALLRETPDPSEAEISRAMEGHVCRCCTYPRIVRALRQAALAAKGNRG